MEKKLLDLKDKNGVQLHVDALIYGTMAGVPGKHHYSLFIAQDGVSIDMYACTYGYVHNIKQADLGDFEYIGLFTDHKDLWCKC